MNLTHRRLELLGLALVFLAPLGGAFALYYGSGFRPGASIAHGELLEPAVALPTVALALPTGETLSSELFARKWSLVYLAPDGCGTVCRARLDELRRLRLALGRDAPRLQRVLLFAHACCDGDAPGAADLATAYAGPAARPLLTPFESGAASARVYLVDPHGNLLMRYPPGAPLNDMLEDLKRLLQLSHIG